MFEVKCYPAIGIWHMSHVTCHCHIFGQVLRQFDKFDNFWIDFIRERWSTKTPLSSSRYIPLCQLRNASPGKTQMYKWGCTLVASLPPGVTDTYRLLNVEEPKEGKYYYLWYFILGIFLGGALEALKSANIWQLWGAQMVVKSNSLPIYLIYQYLFLTCLFLRHQRAPAQHLTTPLFVNSC